MTAWGRIGPVALPLSAQRPVGTSTATRAPGRCRWRASSSTRIPSPGGRCWPMPSRASIQSSLPLGSGAWLSRWMPSHRQWRRCASVSGLCRSKGLQIAVATEARCSSRAITSPSPPLCPGPTSTRAPWRARWSPCRCKSLRLSASAAFSIRAATGMPLWNSCSSKAAISALVTSRWSPSRRGQAAVAGVGTNSSGQLGFMMEALPLAVCPVVCLRCQLWEPRSGLHPCGSCRPGAAAGLAG